MLKVLVKETEYQFDDDSTGDSPDDNSIVSNFTRRKITKNISGWRLDHERNPEDKYWVSYRRVIKDNKFHKNDLIVLIMCLQKVYLESIKNRDEAIKEIRSWPHYEDDCEGSFIHPKKTEQFLLEVNKSQHDDMMHDLEALSMAHLDCIVSEEFNRTSIK